MGPQQRDAQICFVGHTHFPACFRIDPSGRADILTFSIAEPVRIYEGFRYIINVGSVGQPREGNPDSCACLHETGTGLVKLVRIKYNIKIAQEKIIAAGLPVFLAKRLALGI